jgi:hypothetical protein
MGYQVAGNILLAERGGNCLDCHIKAVPQYDLICELEHGCDPIPVTREMVADIQATDTRCLGRVVF